MLHSDHKCLVCVGGWGVGGLWVCWGGGWFSDFVFALVCRIRFSDSVSGFCPRVLFSDSVFGFCFRYDELALII